MPLPSTLGKYHLDREVGRGGFAVVYLAHDPTLGRRVAIKVPHAWLLTDPKFVERFHREARLAANLTHPHIVTIYEIGEEQGTPFIAMEWLEGMPFQDWLRQMQPTPQAALQALAGVGAALDYAHARQVIHRDIKPSNIMMAAGRGGVLTDFGIARSLVQASQSTSSLMGTPNYMAPEVLKGQPATAATDIYALGVMLFEVLTGRLPFYGDTPHAVAFQHASEPPPDPRSLNPTLPKPTAALVLQALAKDPRQRPAGAERLVRELLMSLGAPALKPTPPPVPRRHTWTPVLVGVSILFVVGVVLLWLLATRNHPPEADVAKVEPTQTAAPASSTHLPSFTTAPLTTPPQEDTVIPFPVRTHDTPTPKHTDTLTPTPTATLAATFGVTSTFVSLPDAVVSTTTLSMRAGPGMKYDRLNTYASGEAVRVLGRNATGDWLKVQAPDGQQGWVATALLTLNINPTVVVLIELTPILRPTNTPASTFTPTLRPTNTPASTFTPTLRPTNTPASTFTPTLRPTNTPASTFTPTLRPTNTPTNTLTPEPTPTNTPIPSPTPTFPDGAEMVFVPPGEFLMGSAAGEGYDDERPQHTVYLEAFLIDKTEVSNSQYQRCVDVGACQQSKYFGDSVYNNAGQPVVGVSWEDARAYCAWVGQRLPTEAEWEKAARGTGGRIYPWGNEFDGNRLNYCDSNCPSDQKDVGVSDGYALTSPVGSYPAGASPYGILDMAGNVWEWVADWYDENYYISSPSSNPAGPGAGNNRVLRGGSWDDNPDYVRSGARGWYSPDARFGDFGFRCARSP